MGDAPNEHHFGNIAMGSRGGANQGSLKATRSAIVWKRSGGGRTVEIPAADIKGMSWFKVQRGFMLLVRRPEAPTFAFSGFREPDLASLRSLGLGEISETPLSLSGHNWGKLEVDGASLNFRVGGKQSFVVPLPDVAQAQQSRDEVLLQFPVDDTAGGERDDSLVEITFHVPKDCPDFAPTAPAEDGNAAVAAAADGAALATAAASNGVTATKAFFDLVSAFTDAGAAAGDAIVTFDAVGVLVPRGRFDVELYASSLKLVGQAQDFRVQYDSILRVFVLPKASTSQTLVAVCLDPPIRKGQTYYSTILCQFHNDEETVVELDLGDEALAARNEKGARLSREMSGPSPDIFARVLRGLSGAKLTRPGAFRDASGEGYAVRCSYKAEDGFLYPLERAFFYVQKPPLLMAYDDVDSVEFMRQATGVTAAKTFDLVVRMRGGQDHLFRGIPRLEWTNLFEWIQAKQLRIDNFKEAQRGPGTGPVSYADGFEGGVDPGMAGIAAGASDSEGNADLDEHDHDFAASSESSSSSSGDDSDSDAEIVPEDGAAILPAKKKARVSGEGGSSKPAAAAAATSAGTEKQGGKKPRKKKDKDAPKKALSGFMYFSSDMRDKVKADNPGIAFGEVGKKLGELWKALSAEEKVPYEAKAEEDKQRYAKEMEAYRAKKAAEENATAGDE